MSCLVWFHLLVAFNSFQMDWIAVFSSIEWSFWLLSTTIVANKLLPCFERKKRWSRHTNTKNHVGFLPQIGKRNRNWHVNYVVVEIENIVIIDCNNLVPLCVNFTNQYLIETVNIGLRNFWDYHGFDWTKQLFQLRKLSKYGP